MEITYEDIKAAKEALQSAKIAPNQTAYCWFDGRWYQVDPDGTVTDITGNKKAPVGA